MRDGDPGDSAQVGGLGVLEGYLEGQGDSGGGVQERVWEGLGGGFKKGGPGPTQIQHVGRV